MIHVGRPVMAKASLDDVRLVSQAREAIADIDASRHEAMPTTLRA